MRRNCYTCIHPSIHEDYEKFCGQCEERDGKGPSKWEPVEGWKPDTNADRIRAMSDEELADVLANGVGCVGHVMEKGPFCMEEDCTPCILEWLKQPAE